MPAGADLPTALDTSVAVPLLVWTHRAHAVVVGWWDGRPVALSGHAQLETYSVLTRLPGGARVGADDATRLLAERFEPPVFLAESVIRDLTRLLAERGVAGGAVYDAMVALAASTNGRVLATRDARARTTYEAVGVEVEVVG